jgi:serine/threonine protein kinase
VADSTSAVHCCLRSRWCVCLYEYLNDNVKHIQLDILEHLHSRHIVHCDIKPGNLLFGNPHDASTAGQLHLIDFGFSRYYRDPVSKDLRPCINHQKMIGTRYYSSVNILHGIGKCSD